MARSMAVAFSPPAVAQEDYRCVFLQEDLFDCFFFVILSKSWNIFHTCGILPHFWLTYFNKLCI